MKHTDLFEFEEWASFGGVASNGMLSECLLAVDNENNQLFFQTGDKIAAFYPIPRAEDTPSSISLFWNKAEARIQIGEVNFLGESPSINRSERQLHQSSKNFDCQIQLKDGGGMIVIDIRDIGKIIRHYHFDLVPITLSIEGNLLVITTLVYDASKNLAPWYKEI